VAHRCLPINPPGTRDVDAGTNVEDEGLLRIRGLPTTKQFDADRAVGMTAGRAHHSMFPARLELAENEMPYTVWSRGRLVGHSELAYARVYPDMRMGDFEPTALGEALMPIIVGVSPALRALYDVLEKMPDAGRGGSPHDSGFPPEVRRTTEYADVVSTQDEIEALALQLHDSAGKIVRTEWLWFQDTHRLIALAREEMSALDSDLVFDDYDREPWEPEPPRYQIMVGLEGYEKRMQVQARRHESGRARKNPEK